MAAAFAASAASVFLLAETPHAIPNTACGVRNPSSIISFLERSSRVPREGSAFLFLPVTGPVGHRLLSNYSDSPSS